MSQLKTWSIGHFCPDIEHPYRCEGVSSSSEVEIQKQCGNLTFRDTEVWPVLQCLEMSCQVASKCQVATSLIYIAELSDYSASLLMPAILFKSHASTVIYNSEYEYGGGAAQSAESYTDAYISSS